MTEIAIAIPLSRLLCDLLKWAESELRVQYPLGQIPAWLEALRNDVAMSHRRPAELPRVTDAAMMLADCLCHRRLADDRDRACRWSMIAHALIPMVQEDLWRAIEQEKEIRMQRAAR